MYYWTLQVHFGQLPEKHLNQTIPGKKKLQENIFFQNVTVVHTSTLLTSLPKSFRKLLSVLSKKNKIISGYFKFYEEKMILWILRIMFWQPLLLLSTEHFAESARTIKILWILQKNSFFSKKKSRGHAKWSFDNANCFSL